MRRVFTDNAWADYTWWQGQDKKTLKRINTLIEDICRNGYEGMGKPEPLKGELSGFWSRPSSRTSAVTAMKAWANQSRSKGSSRDSGAAGSTNATGLCTGFLATRSGLLPADTITQTGRKRRVACVRPLPRLVAGLCLRIFFVRSLAPLDLDRSRSPTISMFDRPYQERTPS